MSDDVEWVLLVECSTMAELHTLRATLEARGVPCRVHGEHTHGVLGPIHGAMVRSRVLVPRRALKLARTLAEDIVGPFDERPELDDDDEADASPFRSSAELAPGEPDDVDEPDDDDEASSDRSDALDEGRPRSLRPRSYAVLMLIALMGGAFFGLSHLYVRRNGTALALATLGILAIVASVRGAGWAGIALPVIWVLDLAGGLHGVYADRRRHAALTPAPEPEPPRA